MQKSAFSADVRKVCYSIFFNPCYRAVEARSAGAGQIVQTAAEVSSVSGGLVTATLVQQDNTGSPLVLGTGSGLVQVSGTVLQTGPVSLVLDAAGPQLVVGQTAYSVYDEVNGTNTAWICNSDPDFTDQDYRYGYNGQQKSNEIAGMGNHNTALFWEYDPRLGRRWNLDPKPQISISNYAAFGGNPILFSDHLGNTFDIGSNGASKSDVISLVSAENVKYLSFENNRVTINISGFSEAGLRQLYKNDVGLKLVSDLVRSDKTFLYEASPNFLGKSEDGNKLYRPMSRDDNGVVNASNGGKDSEGGHFFRPKEGYDGQVVIDPKVKFFQQNDAFNTDVNFDAEIPRSSIIFHELSENYERTNNGVNYNGSNGAHELAVKREFHFQGRSNNPGAPKNVRRGSESETEKQLNREAGKAYLREK